MATQMSLLFYRPTHRQRNPSSIATEDPDMTRHRQEKPDRECH